MRRTSWFVAGGVAAVLALPAGVAAAASLSPTPSPAVTSPGPGSGPGPGPGPGSGAGYGPGPRRSGPPAGAPAECQEHGNSPQMQEHRRQMTEKYGPDWTPPRDGTGPFHDQAPGRQPGRQGPRPATT